MDAVIFDLDGTILDSEPWHKRAEIEAFGVLGRHVSEADLLPFTGTTLEFMLRGIAPGTTVEEFLAIEQPILAGHIREDMEAFPDALRLLSRIRVPCAIATSSMKWYLDATTERFPFLGERFPVRVCQADIREGKPHPEIFLLASSLLGVDPSRVLVIEDSRNGVLGAKAAGCRSVGVQRHPGIDLQAADQVVSSLDEVNLGSN
jgi:HAD superfamily hydrolase (TIGR01509 family)